MKLRIEVVPYKASLIVNNECSTKDIVVRQAGGVGGSTSYGHRKAMIADTLSIRYNGHLIRDNLYS